MAISQIINSGESAIIVPDKIEAPHTEIQNRAKLNDVNLKVMMGVERIQFNTSRVLPKEFGPNGEEVWEVQNKDERIRFVGNWKNSFYQEISLGTSIRHVETNWVNDNDFIEIVFYGTGLNIICASKAESTILGQIYLNGVQQADINIGGKSGVITSEGYKSNQIYNIVSGLSQGWHTVKITGKAGNNGSLNIFGCEILNGTSDLVVPKGGKVIASGYTYDITPSNLGSISYNSGFETGTLGTTGGKVVVGVDLADGEIKKYLTPTDAAGPKYLTNTNHTNENVVNIVDYWTFGRQTATDFQTLAGATTDRAFTLDDNVHNLVGDNVQAANGIEIRDIGTSFVTFSFVGTGLDVVYTTDGTATVNTIDVDVDGTNVGSLPTTGHPTENTAAVHYKICSGLPYGFHIVRFSSPSEGFLGRTRIANLVVYESKSPTLPDSVVKLGKYSILADYSLGIVDSDIDTVSTGVIGSSPTREVVYTGTGWTNNLASTNVMGAQFCSSLTVTDYLEFRFFGTGIDLVGTGTGNTQVSIDGSLYTGAATAVGTGSSWTAGTSTWVAGSVNGAGLSIAGLSLGYHIVKVEITSATTFYIHKLCSHGGVYSFDLKRGSKGIKDLRKMKETQKVEPDVLLNYALDFNTIGEAHNISDVVELSGTNGTIGLYYDVSFIDGNITNNRRESYAVAGLSTNTVNLYVTDNTTHKNWCNAKILTTADTESDTSATIVIFGELEEYDD